MPCSGNGVAGAEQEQISSSFKGNRQPTELSDFHHGNLKSEHIVRLERADDAPVDAKIRTIVKAPVLHIMQ